MVENVELTIYNTSGDSLCLDLEPWQVNAIIKILGLRVKPVEGKKNVFDITMFPPKIVNEMVSELKYEWQDKDSGFVRRNSK